MVKLVIVQLWENIIESILYIGNKLKGMNLAWWHIMLSIILSNDSFIYISSHPQLQPHRPQQ